MTADLLRDYAEAWATGRADAIAAFWDADAFRFYKAEEIAEPYFSWDAALAYWRANEALHAGIALGFSDATWLPLGDGWEMSLPQMRWDIRFAAAAPAHLAGRAMGGDNHVLVLTRHGRLAGWCEAPDAPLSYMRRLYEQSARI